MIQFEKISFNQFKESMKMLHSYTDDRLKEIYDSISLPKRATKASAGYDFSLPYDVTVLPNQSILVPTGIRVALKTNLVCLLMPRSSMGMKYGMCLDNTVGVIDADYYGADNEGHIMARLTFKGISEALTLKAGERFMQGIIVNYFTTDNDDINDERSGGFGSTGK